MKEKKYIYIYCALKALGPPLQLCVFHHHNEYVIEHSMFKRYLQSAFVISV